MKKTTTITLWGCDRCGVTQESETRPDCWGHVEHLHVSKDMYGNGADYTHQLDLCQACSDTLKEFLSYDEDKGIPK